jgi:hypothetical protein
MMIDEPHCKQCDPRVTDICNRLSRIEEGAIRSAEQRGTLISQVSSVEQGIAEIKDALAAHVEWEQREEHQVAQAVTQHFLRIEQRVGSLERDRARREGMGSVVGFLFRNWPAMTAIAVGLLALFGIKIDLPK